MTVVLSLKLLVEISNHRLLQKNHLYRKYLMIPKVYISQKNILQQFAGINYSNHTKRIRISANICSFYNTYL